MAGRAEWGSDVVVEMLKQYGIEYAPANLGATYRGLLDSIINFGHCCPGVERLKRVNWLI